MDSSVKKATDDDRCVAQIIAICLGTRCPPRDPSLLVSCSPVPHHVVLEGPLEGHSRNITETKIPISLMALGEMGIVYLF